MGTDRAGWLLDQAPPQRRLVPVLRRHPSVLAWLAVHHLAAQLQAARAAWSDFTRAGDGQVVQEVSGMLAQVGPEPASRLRSAEYLLAALEDTRYAT